MDAKVHVFVVCVSKARYVVNEKQDDNVFFGNLVKLRNFNSNARHNDSHFNLGMYLFQSL